MNQDNGTFGWIIGGIVAVAAAIFIFSGGELGGTDSVENLWPEPARGEWNATQKDALERKLLTMVCDGTLTVKQAQTAIKKNWVQAYQQYVGTGAVATKDQ